MKFLSALMTIASGSVGGFTLFRNQYHQLCMRAKTAPVNPNTSNQLAARTAFSSANAFWKGMSQAQRDGWVDYAKTLVYSGPLGDYAVPGRNVAIGSLQFLEYLNNQGYDTIVVDDDPPLSAGFALIDSIASEDPAVPGTGFDLNIHQSTGDQMAVLIDVSIAFDATRERYKGPWSANQQRYLDLASGVTANVPIDDLIEGQAYFYRVRGVTSDGPHKGTAAFIGRHIAALTSI